MDAREKILGLFRQKPGDFVSGEQISRALGVSRTAVWKKIRILRDLGYEIEAVTSRGYRLLASPDLLMPAEIQSDLDTEVVGGKVVCLQQADSTNMRAFELGEQGAPEGTVVLADSQSLGKGRLGRRWESPAGVNLYASVLLRPAILPMEASQLTFVSAVAAVEAVAEISGLPARVKWPNDILIGGKKVAGLLNEMSGESERINFVVLGIGVNLNMQPEQFPEDLRYPATSVAIELGRPVSRIDFARLLIRRLDDLYGLYRREGFSPILRRWESHCDLIGRQVEVDLNGRLLRGTVSGLDPQGGLLVDSDGEQVQVLAGDVRPL